MKLETIKRLQQNKYKLIQLASSLLDLISNKENRTNAPDFEWTTSNLKQNECIIRGRNSQSIGTLLHNRSSILKEKLDSPTTGGYWRKWFPPRSKPGLRCVDLNSAIEFILRHFIGTGFFIRLAVSYARNIYYRYELVTMRYFETT